MSVFLFLDIPCSLCPFVAMLELTGICVIAFPIKIRMSLVTSWSWNGIHKHKPSYSHPSVFSTAIVNLVKLFQENFSLFQPILHTCQLLYFFTDSTAPSCCSKWHESSQTKFLKIPTTGHSRLQKLSCGGGGGEEPPLLILSRPPSTPNSSPPYQKKQL